jgi:hypothetical protein
VKGDWKLTGNAPKQDDCTQREIFAQLPFLRECFQNMGYWNQQANLSAKIVACHETFFGFQRLYL